MEKINLNRYEQDFINEINKMQKLEKQIKLEKSQETEMLNKMTNEEKLEYSKQQCIRANEFASKNKINQKIIVPKGE